MPMVLWAPYRGPFKAAKADIGSEAAAKVMHTGRWLFTWDHIKYIKKNPTRQLVVTEFAQTQPE